MLFIFSFPRKKKKYNILDLFFWIILLIAIALFVHGMSGSFIFVALVRIFKILHPSRSVLSNVQMQLVDGDFGLVYLSEDFTKNCATQRAFV